MAKSCLLLESPGSSTSNEGTQKWLQQLRAAISPISTAERAVRSMTDLACNSTEGLADWASEECKEVAAAMVKALLPFRLSYNDAIKALVQPAVECVATSGRQMLAASQHTLSELIPTDWVDFIERWDVEAIQKKVFGNKRHQLIGPMTAKVDQQVAVLDDLHAVVATEDSPKSSSQALRDAKAACKAARAYIGSVSVLNAIFHKGGLNDEEFESLRVKALKPPVGNSKSGDEIDLFLPLAFLCLISRRSSRLCSKGEWTCPPSCWTSWTRCASRFLRPWIRYESVRIEECVLHPDRLVGDRAGI